MKRCFCFLIVLLFSVLSYGAITGTKVDKSFSLRCFSGAQKQTCEDENGISVYCVYNKKSSILKWYYYNIQGSDTVIGNVAADGPGKTFSEPDHDGWFKSGFRNGYIKKYFRDGRLYLSSSTDNVGNLQGQSKIYLCHDKDGNIYGEGEYRSSTKIGKWTYYDAQGKYVVYDFADGVANASKVWSREKGNIEVFSFTSTMQAKIYLMKNKWYIEISDPNVGIMEATYIFTSNYLVINSITNGVSERTAFNWRVVKTSEDMIYVAYSDNQAMITDDGINLWYNNIESVCLAPAYRFTRVDQNRMKMAVQSNGSWVDIGTMVGVGN